MRVIVIGAGLAGLAAAESLQQSGADVRVFEARDRVGGRVWSIPFAGAVAERGAEFILPGNTAFLQTAQRLGLALVRKGTLYGAREPRGGAPVAVAELVAALERIACEEERAVPLADVRDQAARWGRAAAVSERLARSELPDAVTEAISARLEVSCAYPADDLDESALSEGAAAFGDFDTHSVQGGNDRLAHALAGALGEQRISLRAPVHRVAWSADGVRVRAGDTEAVADRAVVAVPASVIGQIGFEPGLPNAMLEALRGVRYGQAAKLFVALRRPAPPSATLSVPERFWCYTQLGASGAPLRFLASFAGSPRALEMLDVADGPSRWLASLARLRADLELDADEVLLSRWDDDPWVRGAYSARSASSPMDVAQLRQAVGPLTFAGEHTAGEWHGLMEGALRSGARAAEEVLRGATQPL